MPFVKATKEQLKLRLGLFAVSGAGKTWTALSIAEELADASKIAGLDTERGSMSLYSDRYNFDTQRVAPPYDPQQVIDAVHEAERGGYEVLIIDSLTHYWQGEGGVLSKVDAATARYGGNSKMAWAVGTPLYQRMLDTILGADLHIICTLRAKNEYEETTKANGKKGYERVGTSPVMREGIEYEFTVTASLDLEHRIYIDKTRCDLLDGRTFQPHQEKDLVLILKDWLEAGEPPAGRAIIEALRESINGIAGEDYRNEVKRGFKAKFGIPEFLRAADVDEASAFVAEALEGERTRRHHTEPSDPPQGGDLPPTTTDSERATTDPDRVIDHGTIVDVGPSTDGAPGTYIEERHDEFEVGDSDPGAGPIDPPDANIGAPPRAKPTPSARQLEAAGATPEMLAEGIAAAEPMTGAQARAYLGERGMAINGQVKECKMRVASQWAMELAQAAPRGTVTDIKPIEADDEAPPSQEDAQALMDEMRGFTPPVPERKPCPVCLALPGEEHHAAKHEDAEIIHPSGTAFWGDDGEVHWTDENDREF